MNFSLISVFILMFAWLTIALNCDKKYDEEGVMFELKELSEYNEHSVIVEIGLFYLYKS